MQERSKQKYDGLGCIAMAQQMAFAEIQDGNGVRWLVSCLHTVQIRVYNKKLLKTCTLYITNFQYRLRYLDC